MEIPLFLPDRIYPGTMVPTYGAGRITQIFLSFQTKLRKINPPSAKGALLALQGLSVFPFNLYSGWTKVNENAYLIVYRPLWFLSVRLIPTVRILFLMISISICTFQLVGAILGIYATCNEYFSNPIISVLGMIVR